jgi:prophage regulatory protein
MSANTNHITLLRRNQVEAITGLARSTIYKLIKAGSFPKPIQLTDRAVAWPSNLIDSWVSEKLTSSEVPANAVSNTCYETNIEQAGE